MKQVVVRSLLVGPDEDGSEDVIIERRFLFWWKPAGRFSAPRNKAEHDLVKHREKGEDLLFTVQQEQGRLEVEITDASKALRNKGGWTEPYEMSEKDLKKYEETVLRPEPDTWRGYIANKILRQYGILVGDKTKSAKSKQDSNRHASIDEANTVVHLMDGVDQTVAQTLAKKVGAGSIEIHKESHDKKDSNKQQGKKKQKWSQQRQGESQDDFDQRIAEGPPNN